MSGKNGAIRSGEKKTVEWRRSADTLSRITLEKGVDGLVEEYLNAEKHAPSCTITAFRKNNALGKNRSPYVGCLDETRVVLNNMPNDYIHANYVGFSQKPHRFIITQAPLDTTIVDFWAMIAQEKSEHIVMICDFIEDGKSKCSEYFPRERGRKKIFENFEITCMASEQIKSTNSTSVVISRLKLSSVNGSFNLTHYFLNNWPDRKVPDDPKILIKIMSMIRVSRNPIVVHCSTGIGRSGTFVGIELMLETVSCNLPLPHPNLLDFLRRQRAHAISTDLQYVFIFDFILDYFRTEHIISQYVITGIQKFHEEFENLKASNKGLK
ncbi:unnamed protein product [Bursaphelenchus xylophilus]|uniref:(pine wood nematode) hypothetical protein n=1 Tax=Bursaphelenchus xylophilus TaxID=6326 RepID=A0A1I7RSC1_BURXY|nr:unnamed protein product [Bursaphelenchus xylophilus]CAG9123058.1 unnamed protein product [Bursaphelenchus xylophilus]